MAEQKIMQNLQLVDIFYPVGTYYETSDVNFDPNVRWGGTWELEAEGQVHVSAGTNYSVNGALTNTSDGGDTTSATGDHTLTISEIPSHEGHLARNSGSYTGYGNATAKYLKQEVLSNYGSNGRGWNVNGGEITPYGMSRGGGGAHNHGNVSTMQPYIVVNRWHRTA